MGSHLMNVTGVKKYFGGVKAVDGVDFYVDEGEIIGLIGPNGSGKTTLFNLISGIYPPSGGEVTFRSQRITGKPAHRIAQLGVSRTFQNIRLFNDLTVFENVMVGSFLSVRSVSRMAFALRTKKARNTLDERVRSAQRILNFVGIEHLYSLRASSLSYGDQRRLEIARALAAEPHLLLLDEPTAGMNPREREGAVSLFKKINSAGITLVVVEHHMRVIMGICSRITVLDQGKKIAEGSAQQVQKDQKVIEAYLGETLF